MEEESISFEDLGLDETTLAAVARKGFVTPSPIQVLAIPRLLNGEANLIARARTGTGKTAAFGLPLVQKLREGSDCVKALILEPTRELAMQTCTEMASFTTGRFPRTAVVYGGASMGEQIRELRNGVEVVVGTPGRVQDLIDRGVLKLDKIDYFILDEGDEMLDMGFIDDIEKIFTSANPDSRILLFSATVPAPILKIASKFMGEYEIVEEEGHEEEPLLIEQKYWIVKQGEKIEALIRLIDISPDFYGLVFVQKKTDADYVCKQLDEKGYQVAALHGDIPQGQREKILARFRAKKTRILVATDVAARGIDINGLTHVVNYELPFDGPTYVHRIGRTGRAGSAGMAVTFVRPEERRRMQYLVAAIKRSAKGEMTEGSVPTVEEILDVKKIRLFDEVKEKLGLKKPEDFEEENKEKVADEKSAEKSSKKKASKKQESFDDEEVVPFPKSSEEKPADDKSTEEKPSEEKTADDKSNVSSDASSEEKPAENADGASEEKTAENADSASEEKSDAAEGDASKSESTEEKPADETEESFVPQLKKGDPIFDQLAAELCTNQNPQEVVASLLAATYGNALSKNRYGKINGAGGGRGGAVPSDQIRLYVQMGWHDGYNPRAIADFFSDLLNIPGRLVDKIDMADKFCLLNLPIADGKKALELSQSDSSLPHMHQDTKNSGGDEGGGRGFGGGRGRGGRDRGGFRGGRGFGGDGRRDGGFGRRGGGGFGRRGDGDGDNFGRGGGSFGRRSEGGSHDGDFGDSFGSRDRYAVGRDRDDRRRSSNGGSGRGGRSDSRGGSHSRSSVHTPTERNSRAAVYKKKSGPAEEY